MGAGKTTIGRKIAQQYNSEFYDSDRVIEERTGVSIPLIFDLEGEKGFRKREAEVISDLITKENIVLATGGGAVLLEENRKLMKENAFIIFLNASIEQLFNRTSRDKNRPLLQTDNPKKKLQQILNERMDIYKSIADLEVVTDNQSISLTVNNLIKTLSKI